MEARPRHPPVVGQRTQDQGEPLRGVWLVAPQRGEAEGAAQEPRQEGSGEGGGVQGDLGGKTYGLGRAHRSESTALGGGRAPLWADQHFAPGLESARI